MRLSAGLSLALLSTAANIACGFSLKPSATKNVVNINIQNDSTLARKPFVGATSSLTQMKKFENVRGGSVQAASTAGQESESSSSLGNTVASFWAAGGVVMILAKSIKRVLPIALEPFGKGAVAPLSTLQLGAYIGTCLFFAYVEGYKGFQLKFSPLVVARAQTLKPFNGTPFHHTLFAPFYAMGLFHATKKRKIISWSVSTGVAVIVVAVKKLPYPWRNIIDAGVIVGLSWGSMSIIVEWFKAVVLGKEVKMDPALPDSA